MCTVRVGACVQSTHSVATIKLNSKQFSLVGEVASEGTELCYTTLQFYKQIPSTVNVDFILVVVHNLEPYLVA